VFKDFVKDVGGGGSLPEREFRVSLDWVVKVCLRTWSVRYFEEDSKCEMRQHQKLHIHSMKDKII